MTHLSPLLADFLREDAGAVTVDWVMLAGCVLLLGIVAVYSVYDSAVNTLVAEFNADVVLAGAIGPDGGSLN